MDYNYELDHNQFIVYVPKELDHHVADILKNEIDEFIREYDFKELVFDFQETDFMDSSGIGVLIGRSKGMNYIGGKVIARNMNHRIKKIFSVSGLKKMIEIEGTEEGGHKNGEK